MIERVTQALREVLWNYGVQLTKEMDELLARAAIEVMREPTGNQLDAGYAANSERQCDDDLAFGWRAMIDEALREKE